MSAVVVKIGLGFVAAAVLIGVVQTRLVSDALLLFAAAGIVPGTSIALSPNATLYTLLGMLAGSAALIFRKEIIRVLRPVRAIADESVVVIQAPGETADSKRQHLLDTINRYLDQVVAKIRLVLGRLMPKLRVLEQLLIVYAEGLGR